MIRQFIEGRRQPIIYSLASIVFSVILIALVGGWYVKTTADHAVRKSEQRWCAILAIYHDAYKNQPPPPTQTGRDVVFQLERQYTEFHCERASRKGR